MKRSTSLLGLTLSLSSLGAFAADRRQARRREARHGEEGPKAAKSTKANKAGRRAPAADCLRARAMPLPRAVDRAGRDGAPQGSAPRHPVKLARKITLALALLAFAVIAGMETIEVQRELARSALDMQHDHRLLGHTLGGSFVRAWEARGRGGMPPLLDGGQPLSGSRCGWAGCGWTRPPGDMLRLPRHAAVLDAGRDTYGRGRT